MVEPIVEKFNKVVTKLRESASISLFAILKMDDLADRWSIVVSAPAAEDHEKRKELSARVFKMLTEYLKESETQEIARVGIFPLTDHLVKDLIGYDSGEELHNVRVNGNTVHYGYVVFTQPINNSQELPLRDEQEA